MRRKRDQALTWSRRVCLMFSHRVHLGDALVQCLTEGQFCGYFFGYRRSVTARSGSTNSQARETLHCWTGVPPDRVIPGAGRTLMDIPSFRFAYRDTRPSRQWRLGDTDPSALPKVSVEHEHSFDVKWKKRQAQAGKSAEGQQPDGYGTELTNCQGKALTFCHQGSTIDGMGIYGEWEVNRWLV